jgi:hypothetical protein
MLRKQVQQGTSNYAVLAKRCCLQITNDSRHSEPEYEIRQLLIAPSNMGIAVEKVNHPHDNATHRRPAKTRAWLQMSQ